MVSTPARQVVGHGFHSRAVTYRLHSLKRIFFLTANPRSYIWGILRKGVLISEDTATNSYHCTHINQHIWALSMSSERRGYSLRLRALFWTQARVNHAGSFQDSNEYMFQSHLPLPLASLPPSLPLLEAVCLRLALTSRSRSIPAFYGVTPL